MDCPRRLWRDGLGLSSVKNFVDAGGRISVESESGQGAFHIHITS